MNVAVSVIVPMYNAERFVRRCLDSLIAQDFPAFEIIVVDDGSLDAGPQTLREYTLQDERIVLLRQENLGVSVARNRGIDAARGEFVAFVDADDHVTPEYLSALVEAITGCDLATCAYAREGNRTTPHLLGKSGRLSKEELYLHTYVTGKIGGGCWNKLFRKSILDREGIRYPQGIAVGEDMVFLARYYQFCPSFQHVDRPLYSYVLQPQSAVQKSYSRRIIQESTLSILDALDMLETQIDLTINYQRRSFAYRRARSSLRLLFQLVLAGEYKVEALQRMQAHLRAGLLSFLLTKKTRDLEKAMVLLAALSSRLAYRIAKPIVSRRPERFATFFE